MFVVFSLIMETSWSHFLLLLLEIRPSKTTMIIIEETETENCVNKAKFTFAEGCRSTQAWHAPRTDHRSAFLSPMLWTLPPLLGLVEFGGTICSQLANATLGIWGWGR
jgi:hypothetical protein